MKNNIRTMKITLYFRTRTHASNKKLSKHQVSKYFTKAHFKQCQKLKKITELLYMHLVLSVDICTSLLFGGSW